MQPTREPDGRGGWRYGWACACAVSNCLHQPQSLVEREAARRAWERANPQPTWPTTPEQVRAEGWWVYEATPLGRGQYAAGRRLGRPSPSLVEQFERRRSLGEGPLRDPMTVAGEAEVCCSGYDTTSAPVYECRPAEWHSPVADIMSVVVRRAR